MPPTQGDAFALARRLQAEPGIRSAEAALRQPGADPRPGHVSPHAPCSDDPDWALTHCRVRQAWALQPPEGGRRFGEGVTIAHPDTGYTRHPEVYSERVRVDEGFDFEDEDPDAHDSLSGQSPGHGTATASVAMSTQGSQGDWASIDGVAPMARLVPYRVASGVIHIDFVNVVRSIDRAIRDGHHVISLSLGGPIGPHYVHRAVRRAVRRGIVLVAAAGNVWPWVVYPGKYAETVCVAASTCHDRPWDASARGGAVDLSAPGESVWRAQVTDGAAYDTGRSSGTSYATALTAGACALWLAFHGRDNLIARYGSPAYVPTVFKQVLTTHGVRRVPGWATDAFGAGILDVEALLQAPLPAEAPPTLDVEGPEPLSALDEIASFFPDLAPEDIKRALCRFLVPDPSQLEEAVESVAEEICFLTATEPDFRAAIRACVTGEARTPNAPVPAETSEALRALLR